MNWTLPCSRNGLARGFILFLFTPLVLPALVVRAQETAPTTRAIRLSDTEVPASGRRSSVLAVERFGRYSIQVASPNGTGIQLVDRRAGPLEKSGTPSEKDGRLDVFLDQGEHKLLTEGPARAKGKVRISVQPFEEKNGPKPPLLVELKPVDTSLSDLEQLSYWLEIPRKRTVILEAAGRNLTDLRLWKDGTWLMDSEPTREAVQPVIGKPLLVLRLVMTLDEGLYLLTAYGGEGQPWAEESVDRPFHLRFGIPLLPQAVRRRFTVGPFGYDRYRVPGGATYFRVELPQANAASLSVVPFEEENPWRSGPLATITKKSLPPVGELTVDSRSEREHLVVVTGTEGQPYLLQHFDARTTHSIQQGSGDYWISTVHSGHAVDSIDATAILVESGDGSAAARPSVPLALDVVPVNGNRGFARRANLLEAFTVFLNVEEAGSYEVTGSGAEALYRIEPFLTSQPPEYKTPDALPGGSRWDLIAGLYVLSAVPVKKGILDLTVRKVGMRDPLPQDPVRPSVVFPKLHMEESRIYTLYLNEQPGVKAGLVLRRLPVDLSEPLPVAPRSGEPVTVPFTVTKAGTLRAEGEDGSLLGISLDGGLIRETHEVRSGTHTATIRPETANSLLFTLLVEDPERSASTPLKPLPDTALSALPDLPVLAAETPRFFDLSRYQAASFRVKASQPGLYRLESSGLLGTSGNLRTRTVTSFRSEDENGIGRNFLIQDYLREGDFLLTVSARGESAGHLGLSLSRTNLIDGGLLSAGTPARITLPPGEAVVYRFTVKNRGEYKLSSFGMNRVFKCRLEDSHGWPIEKPGIPADITRTFPAGSYQLVILPEDVRTRSVTLLERTAHALRFKGHGPHRLALQRAVSHEWRKQRSETGRRPDSFGFQLPAAATVRIQLDGEMQANLSKLNPDGSLAPVSAMTAKQGFKGPLLAGRYRIDASPRRRDNRVAYKLGVFSDELLAGETREVEAPKEIAVSLQTTGLVELSSSGNADVRGRLYESGGRLVASSDDRPDDWNFAIVQNLAAGRYRLVVEPARTSSARCRVSMTVPSETASAELLLPVAQEVNPGRGVLLFPFGELPEGAGLLIVSAASGETVGVSLEKSTLAGQWQPSGTSIARAARVAIPVDPQEKARFRARVWSVDHRGTPIRLRAVAAALSQATERELAGGITLAPIAGLDSPVGAVRLQLARPGIFRMEPSERPVFASAGPSSALRESATEFIAATGTQLTLLQDLPAGKASVVRAARVVLKNQEAGLPLRISPGEEAWCDLSASTSEAFGPVVVLARSTTGQPGLQFLQAGQTVDASLNTAVAPRLAAAVSLAKTSAVRLFSAGMDLEPVEVFVTLQSFPRPVLEKPERPGWEGVMEGISARAFDLMPGPKQIRLALDEGVIGVLSKGEDVTSVHWGGGDPVAETVSGSPDRLTLLHLRAAPDRFSSEVIAVEASAVSHSLAPGTRYERNHVVSGAFRLSIPAAEAAGKPATVHVRGAKSVTFVDRYGRVREGTDLPVGAGGGTLLVSHPPGLVVAWMAADGMDSPGLFTASELGTPVPVRPPAALPLSGVTKGFRLETKVPVLLQVRASSPSVTLLKRPAASPLVDVHARGTVLHAYLPPGESDLFLRAAGGAVLHGTVELVTTPVTPAGEGLGPEILLSAGQSHLFSFVVTRKGPVGIGVRASSDVVDCHLLDTAGARIGTGVVQMPDLTPGTYILALTAPGDAQPVRAHPALAGLAPPSSGPPEDIIRSYVHSEEPGTSFTSRRAEPEEPVSVAAEDSESEEAGTEDEEEASETEEEEPEEGGGE